MKKRFMLFVMLLIIGSLTACQHTGKNGSQKSTVRVDEDQDIKIVTSEAKFVIDVYSYPELAGAADYVCVGEVVEELETTNALSEEQVKALEEMDKPDNELSEEERKALEEVEGKGNSNMYFSPQSHYMVQVKENLKGELDQSKPIRIDKTGGFMPDGKSCELFENDILPSVGEEYVFFIWAQEDGSNRVSGPNSNIPLNPDDMGRASTMTDGVRTTDREAVLEKVRDAVNNQVSPPEPIKFDQSNDDVGK